MLPYTYICAFFFLVVDVRLILFFPLFGESCGIFQGMGKRLAQRKVVRVWTINTEFRGKILQCSVLLS
jgi:hypothetical protein